MPQLGGPTWPRDAIYWNDCFRKDHSALVNLVCSINTEVSLVFLATEFEKHISVFLCCHDKYKNDAVIAIPPNRSSNAASLTQRPPSLALGSASQKLAK